MTPSMMDPPPSLSPKLNEPKKDEVKINMEPKEIRTVEEKESLAGDLKKKELLLPPVPIEYEEKEQPPEYFITRKFYDAWPVPDLDVKWKTLSREAVLVDYFWDLLPFIKASSKGKIVPDGEDEDGNLIEHFNDFIYFVVRDLADPVVCLSLY